MRYLKQVGAASYIFPGAQHSRFEHSLGVGHLAYSWVTALKQNQPGLNITDPDILCVTIAGLCHDLGHGPFSHVFDRLYEVGEEPPKWQHEYRSVEMFKLILKSCTLFLTPSDIKFIEELILGDKIENGLSGRSGRCKEKEFLYDIGM